MSPEEVVANTSNNPYASRNKLMNNKTMSRLIESGWTKGRKIDITEIEDKLAERGFMCEYSK